MDPKRPHYHRQRSSSCNSWTRETINVEINLIRRRSLGNIKFNIVNPTVNIPESGKSNGETIINIPAVIRAKNASLHTVNVSQCQSVCSDCTNCSNADNCSIKNKSDIQSPWIALRELIIPFMIAGFGNVSAGIILNIVQDWEAFKEIPILIILITALIGLNGNVESTLASRLSTHANLGEIDDPKEMRTLVKGNMSLIHCQATVVGIIAASVAVALSYISGAHGHRETTFSDVVLVLASSVVAINLVTMSLGTLMCTVIVLSRKFRINPDNIATPIATSMGDGITLILLAVVSNILYTYSQLYPWLPGTVLGIFLAIAPFLAFIARRNRFTKSVIVTGWWPFIGAMLLDNIGGMVMERAIDRFDKLAEFQPVMNGVGGNLAAIQSSRLSTWLHQTVEKGQLPKNDQKLCTIPGEMFFRRNDRHSKMSRILLVLSAPSHFFFLIILRFVQRDFEFTPLFVIAYILTAVIQVAILLYVTHILVLWLWTKKINPDNTSLPFLTALGDLLGSVLLAATFFILHALNDQNAVYNDITNYTTNSTLILTSTTIMS